MEKKLQKKTIENCRGFGSNARQSQLGSECKIRERRRVTLDEEHKEASNSGNELGPKTPQVDPYFGAGEGTLLLANEVIQLGMCRSQSEGVPKIAGTSCVPENFIGNLYSELFSNILQDSDFWQVFPEQFFKA